MRLTYLIAKWRGAHVCSHRGHSWQPLLPGVESNLLWCKRCWLTVTPPAPTAVTNQTSFVL